MEKNHIKILKLMEAIEKDNSHSQRELSEKLNISLGLVNKLIKDLKYQGFIKAGNHIKTRPEYILTIEGFTEKNKLKAKHISYSINFYKIIKGMIHERLVELKSNERKKFVFYGAGELCEIACILLSHKNQRKVKIVDNEKAGKYICGNKIYKEAEIAKMDFDGIIIMEADNNNVIRKKLINKGISSDKIHHIFKCFVNIQRGKSVALQ
jgi:biotin operon repressor